MNQVIRYFARVLPAVTKPMSPNKIKNLLTGCYVFNLRSDEVQTELAGIAILGPSPYLSAPFLSGCQTAHAYNNFATTNCTPSIWARTSRTSRELMTVGTIFPLDTRSH
jgi:hypothetical protein